MIAFFSTPYQTVSEFASHLTAESQLGFELDLYVQRLSKENQYATLARGSQRSVMLLISRLAQMGVFGLESVITETYAHPQDQGSLTDESLPTIPQSAMKFASMDQNRLLVSLNRAAVRENWPETVVYNSLVYRWVSQAAVTHPRFFGCSIYELQTQPSRED